jgi:putative ABC transport system ATP-binding protein
MELERLHHVLFNPRSNDRYTVVIERLVFPRESFICILGESGCGKTTLLTLIGLARRPEGPDPRHKAVEKFVIREPGANGQEAHDLVELWASGRGRRKIEDLRRRLLGFALQSGELLPTLTVEENVAMPLRLNRWTSGQERRRVRELLDRLSPEPLPADGEPAGTATPHLDSGNGEPAGIESLLWARRRSLPADISGGQYQRVALARALAHKPQLLFVDEPTGNLDSVTARQALGLLDALRVECQTTVVMITHDELLARDYAQYIVRMGVIGKKRGGIIGYERKIGPHWIEVDGLDTLNPIGGPPATDAPPAAGKERE